MNRFQASTEAGVNIAIIAAALVLSAALIQNHFFPILSPSNTIGTQKAPGITSKTFVGQKVSLPDMDWAKNGTTLILALQSGCHYCAESGPFYREIVQKQAIKRQVRLVAVLPQSIDVGKKYMTNLGVAVDEVRQAPLDSIGVIGTPTLLLVDSRGVVTDTWVGKLPEEARTQVISKLHLY